MENLSTNPTEQTDQNNDWEEMASGTKAEEQSEPKEKIVILSKGELSTLERAEFPDGKSSIRLESQYFDKHKDFTDKDSDFYKKYNHDLALTVDSFAFDVALVDATNGKNLENSKTRAVDNYAKLQKVIESPKTSTEEKSMVSDYLKTMDGKALNLIEEKYQGEKENNGEEIERVRRQVEEQQAFVEAAEMFLDFDSKKVMAEYDKMNELLNASTKNPDELRHQLHLLVAALEDMADSISRMMKDNDDYNASIHANREILPEDEVIEHRKHHEDADELIISSRGKYADMEEKVGRIRKYISNFEEAIASLDNF